MQRIVVRSYAFKDPQDRRDYYRLTLDCGHLDDIPVGMRRYAPTVHECTVCKPEKEETK